MLAPLTDRTNARAGRGCRPRGRSRRRAIARPVTASPRRPRLHHPLRRGSSRRSSCSVPRSACGARPPTASPSTSRTPRWSGGRPFGDLLSYLRHTDLHPPLDYILRAPFARAGASDFMIRFPSVVLSTAALALFAWWMRARGWFGVVATALMAVSTFQLTYGGEARMYALLQLLGVCGRDRGRAVAAPSPGRGTPGRSAGSCCSRCSTTCRGSSSPAGCSWSPAPGAIDRRGSGASVSAPPPLLWIPLWGPAFLEQRHLRQCVLDSAHHDRWHRRDGDAPVRDRRGDRAGRLASR